MNPEAATDRPPAVDPPSNGHAPIRWFVDEVLPPDDPAHRQLEELAAMPGVERHIAVLPDVHYKSRNPTPSGTVVVTSDVVLPRAIDDGINCGMRSMVTSVAARDLSPAVLDRLFTRLLEAVPFKQQAQPHLGEADCEEVLVHGLKKAVEPLGLPPDEVARTENGGTFDLGIDREAIRAALPRNPIRKERVSIGSLGGGNHFLELQEVVEILDPEAARRLGLPLGAAMFMMHSDSRRLGKKLLKKVQREAESAHRKPGQSELWSLPVGSDLGQRYLALLTATMHAGFANRAMITHIVRHTMREVLGDPSFELRLVCDSGHETIQPEVHGGRRYWVHRHGASHPVPPGAGVPDPALADLGQPVPLAGCLGMDSYVCLPLPGIDRTFHSGPHGAGRVISKGDAAAQFDPAEVESEVRDMGVRLYRYHSDNIAGQAPRSFKNVARVVGAMTRHDLLRPVVRLKPLAALKG
ncbi:MAG TPA: RtcB family protein [Planctomycetota bacterium]|jgi:tRNA-splicing ligase RtcB|nr:RtcB family protein [Planctomycetota bacterium]